jgi:hypothetical protein
MKEIVEVVLEERIDAGWQSDVESQRQGTGQLMQPGCGDGRYVVEVAAELDLRRGRSGVPTGLARRECQVEWLT